VTYPSNVLRIAGDTVNRGHPAVFPEALPRFFIKLFTLSGDMVCDPFAGSGTTLVVAKQLGRKYIGCEMVPKYLSEIYRRLSGNA
jgi:site-specific DNA-methyltransferase (adenine-specific)